MPFERNNMLDLVNKLFSGQNARRDAQQGLARIISRYDVSRMCYEEGVVPDRRSREERHVALGVWLIPCDADDRPNDIRVDRALPAVTHDVRSEGVGILTPLMLESQNFVVAMPFENSGFQFYKAVVKHNSDQPGGWHLLGLYVERVIELDGDQRAEFRQHTAEICNG